MERKFGRLSGITRILTWTALLLKSDLNANFKKIMIVLQVKPLQQVAKDLSKKLNKDSRDQGGIFMGECK